MTAWPMLMGQHERTVEGQQTASSPLLELAAHRERGSSAASSTLLTPFCASARSRRAWSDSSAARSRASRASLRSAASLSSACKRGSGGAAKWMAQEGHSECSFQNRAQERSGYRRAADSRVQGMPTLLEICP